MCDLNYNTRPKSPTLQQKEAMKKNKSEKSSVLQCKVELKSSIPRPIPFTRRSSSVTPLVTSHHNHNCLSANFLSDVPNKKSYSLPYRSPSPRDDCYQIKSKLPRFPSEKLMQISQKSLISKMANRPKSAGILRSTFQMSNQYANVKAKVNSNLIQPVSSKIVRPLSPILVRPGSPKLVRPGSPKLVHPGSPKLVHPGSPKLVRPVSPNLARSTSPKLAPLLSPKLIRPVSPKIVSPGSPKCHSKSTNQNSTDVIISAESKTSISIKSTEDNYSSPAVEQRQLSDENIDMKQKRMMSTHNEMKELQSIAERQVLELKIQPNISEKPKSPLCEKPMLLAEDSPEFLTKFEERMEKVLESWLRFICDVISHKLMIGNSSLSRITLPDPFKDPRNEVYKFLAQMPTEGDNLQLKLQNIEEELLKVKTVVMHKVTSLWKDFEDLKDEHWRLEKTQDQLHCELQEELEILNDENKTLDKKYVIAVDKYNQEKAKYEAQEKNKLLINRDIVEMKKKIKYLEGKCTEWQFNVKKFESESKAIEALVRNKSLALDKEAKQHRELFCRYNDAQETINELNTEIVKRNEACVSLEEINKTLQQEISVMKASMEESLEKRNALAKELEEKIQKINEAESELNKIRTVNNNNNPSITQTTTNEVPSVLVKDVQERDAQIQELMKKLHYVENTLYEKSNIEEELRKQVKNLQIDHSLENEVALKAQVAELQYVVKDLIMEKAELEKIVAQKSLELDQRDLLIKQNSQIIHARDEIIPLIQRKQINHKECTERLRAVVLDHEKTYKTQDKDGFYSTENMIMGNMEALNNFFMHDPSAVERELAFHQGKMAEVYSLLERKELEMMRLEDRLCKLQKLHEEKEKMEQEREERFSTIQKEFRQSKERKANRSRGFFSMFINQDY